MGLSDEARKARNEYLRNWRRNNKDKVKKYNSNYWERKAKETGKQDKEKATS